MCICRPRPWSGNFILSVNQLWRIVRDVHFNSNHQTVVIADGYRSLAFALEAFIESETALHARQLLWRARYGGVTEGTLFPWYALRRCSDFCPSFELLNEDLISIGNALLRNSLWYLILSIREHRVCCDFITWSALIFLILCWHPACCVAS